MWRTWSLGLGTLVSGAAFAWIAQVEPLAAEQPAPVLETEQTHGKPRGVTPAAQLEPEGSQHAEAVAEREPAGAAEPRDSVAAQRPTPSGPELAAIRERAQQVAEQDRLRHESIQKQIDERDLVQARRAVSITMYSTSWCGVCTTARKYMDEKHILYVERDVDESPSAKARARQLNPRGSVPTFDIDGEAMIGFGDEHLEEMLDRAARKRQRR